MFPRTPPSCKVQGGRGGAEGHTAGAALGLAEGRARRVGVVVSGPGRVGHPPDRVGATAQEGGMSIAV